jgi:hypothetical protein
VLALTEIAKSNPLIRKELKQKIEEIVQNEKNNRVKNVYSKALGTANKYRRRTGVADDGD